MRSEKRSVGVLWVMLATWLGGCAGAPNAAGPAVQAWTETMVLPTYPVGPPSDFPEFVRTSGLQQGPARGLYPYTFQRDLSFQRRDEGYETYVLQNEYLRIEVLPALGGRLFAMYDRSAGQDILYRQVSIKPGLVGLRGAWICGGIEWNFPRGHTVTTFDTVSCRLVRHEDGSASIVVGDTERTFRMSWTVELTLRPGRARVETRILCRNPTPVVHDGYWWSNATFPANDQTQIIFPFHKVTGHEAEGMTDWPVRDGRDVSWYREYPSASSVFRAAGEEDFMAAYDHGRDVGLAQYADRHVMPGRKWWTWGTNDSGLRWARTLSDDDRPYVEIQSGYPLTQGQQFRMQPHMEKQFLEYWMPVTRIGPPARVNPEAVVRLTVDKGAATVGVMPTGRIQSARIELSAGGRVLKQWQRTLSPAEVFKDSCPLNGSPPDSLWVRVFDSAGREIIAHHNGHYAQGEPLTEPGPRRDAEFRPPAEVEKFESAVGQIGQGLFAQAAESLTSLAAGAGKEIDADAVRYYLGLAEAGLGRSAEAMKHWDAVKAPGEIRDAAAVETAKLLLTEGKWQQVIARLAPLASRSPCHAEAETYTALALRQMNRLQEARTHVQRALQRDPLMLLAATELAILDGRGFQGLSALRDEERRIEAATAYMAIEQYATAERLLPPAAGMASSATAAYLRAYVADRMGNAAEAARLRQEAARASVRGCLPSRLEELAAFQAALRANDKDASAHYLAGLVLYGRNRRDEGAAHWQQAGALGHGDAIVYRCLGGVVGEKDPAEAVKYFERAAALAPEAAEVYADLDYAYTQVGQTAKRIEALERGLARLPEKDELAHRLGVAYSDAGRYDDAVKCYASRQFHVAEGQRDLHDNYAVALVGRAMAHLSAGRNKEALGDLDAALEYPENLGIGRPERGGSSATVQYWRGVVLSDLGRGDDARKAWQEATARTRFSQRRGFWSPDSAAQAVHSVMALRRLGQDSRADDLADQIQQACQRLESLDPRNGKAYAAMVGGLLAAADGQADQAAKLLDQAQSGSPRLAGYLRLVRTWAGLLARTPASRPAAR